MLSHHGRSSGGVLLWVKRTLEKFVSVLDLLQDNMVWLKIDRSVFSCEKHVVLCGACYVHLIHPIIGKRT